MDKKTTRILFSIDKNVQFEHVLNAALHISKKANLSLTYVETSDSYNLLGNMDMDSFKADFKRTHFKDIEYLKSEGPLWKTLAKVADGHDCNMVVVGANCVKVGFLGGGMTSTVDPFNVAVLFLNAISKWEAPNTILMPLDGQSETRQKFYRVFEWAQIIRSSVHVYGVSSPSDKEDTRYVHAYALQGKNYMEEHKVQTTLEEVSAKDAAQSILERSQQLRPCWISAVSNSEGLFKTSAFQKVCEKSEVPVLITPFKEISGMGGVGY